MAMKYLDMTGKTEEEAVSKALAELGLDRDDVSVEILERAKKGLFGIGASPAKVRVTYGLEDPEPVDETEEDPPENESEEFQDTYEEESEWEDPEPERKSGKNRQAKTAGKERKRRGIFK